jgi:hypothetical protein
VIGKRFNVWLYGCGHPEVSPGIKCKCRLIFPIVVLMLLGALMKLAAR